MTCFVMKSLIMATNILGEYAVTPERILRMDVRGSAAKGGADGAVSGIFSKWIWDS